MLEKIDLTKKCSKQEFREAMKQLEPQLAKLQRECQKKKIPVMIVFEGWGASGKGTLINQLIHPLDPRGFQVFSIQGESEEERLRPFMWRFFTKIPPKGKIHVFDRSWYQKVISGQTEGSMNHMELVNTYNEIVNFEQNLTVDGTLIIKFFLHISKAEQKKRFDKLEASKETSWRVTKKDWNNHKHYKEILPVMDDMMLNTDTDFAPWTIVEADDNEYALVKIMSHVIRCMEEALQKGTVPENKKCEWTELTNINLKNGALAAVDLSKKLTRTEYKKRLKELQNKIHTLHSEMYRERVPVVLAFEGWDAGGKGGAIKRITECMDPRGYEVIPTASPNAVEREYHYLWRFWRKMPKAGHMAIFDRTWYGRVMVERIEGFCTEAEWRRAYNEINKMEQSLVNAGCVVLKFWMHIDKDEQKRRFEEREQNPDKQWKITEEDWRNREKWDQYEEAVDEMLVRTSTSNAPWIIVEGNDKLYARIKVLETVVDALEKALGRHEK